MSETFAERCAAAVAAVRHAEGCRMVRHDCRTNDYGHSPCCDCDRDARIGRGMAAACKAYWRTEECQTHKSEYDLYGDDVGIVLAAFTEAAK